MPREKLFDLDDAIAGAQKVFWAKGYEATSLADLTEGMGINKGSLYNAFGSKKALFIRALLKYDLDNRQATLKQLAAIDDPVVVLTKLFDGVIAESLADSEHKGCLMINTALDLPNHGEDIRHMVTDALGDFEFFFRRLIVAGQKSGKISKDVKARQTAKSLLALVVGLRVLARGVFDIASLRAIKKDALRLITG